MSFHDTERSEILGGLSYHDMESEAPFTLRKIFGTASDKNGTCTKKWFIIIENALKINISVKISDFC